MVQEFTAWMPELAFNTVRMRQLLQKYKDFYWGYEEEEEFQAVKVRMCVAKCIQPLDPVKTLMVLADTAKLLETGFV